MGRTLFHCAAMRSIVRHLATVARLASALLLVAALGGCALFSSDAPAGSARKGWTLWPWGDSQVSDATPFIEYQRTRSVEKVPMYTLTARNTHLTKTIEGQMRTTMQTSPSDLKMDSQSFTLAPNEQKKLLVYPARLPLTYEVTATFRP